MTAEEAILRIARAVASEGFDIERVDPCDYEHLAETVEAMASPSCANLTTLIAGLRDMRRDPHLSCIYRGTVVGGEWTRGPWVVVSTCAHVTLELSRADTEYDAITAAMDSWRLHNPPTQDNP